MKVSQARFSFKSRVKKYDDRAISPSLSGIFSFKDIYKNFVS